MELCHQWRRHNHIRQANLVLEAQFLQTIDFVYCQNHSDLQINKFGDENPRQYVQVLRQVSSGHCNDNDDFFAVLSEDSRCFLLIEIIRLQHF